MTIVPKEDREYMKKNTPLIYKTLRDTLNKQFDYEIEPEKKESKGSVSKSEFSGSPIRIDKSTEETVLIIDPYTQLYKANVEFTDNVVRRSAFVPKNDKKKSTDLNANIVAIEKFGINGFFLKPRIVAGEEQFTYEMNFPPVMRLETKNNFTRTRTYQYFVLRRVHTSRSTDTENFISKDPNQRGIIGNKAEYVKIDLKGSNQQNPIGFMFDVEAFSRPGYPRVREYVAEKAKSTKSSSFIDRMLRMPDDEAFNNIDLNSSPGGNAAPDFDNVSFDGFPFGPVTATESEIKDENFVSQKIDFLTAA
jgi:hypothetical protein